MVCVPAFASTGQAALLDLETLDCTPLSFSSSVGGAAAVDDKTAAAGDVSTASSAMDVEAPTAAD